MKETPKRPLYFCMHCGHAVTKAVIEQAADDHFCLGCGVEKLSDYQKLVPDSERDIEKCRKS